MRILPIILSAIFMQPSAAFTPTSLGQYSRYTPNLKASALEELSKLTTLSIDSGDLDVVEKFAKEGLITDGTFFLNIHLFCILFVLYINSLACVSVFL